MRETFVLLTLAMLLQSATDDLPRRTAVDVVSAVPLADLQACVIRYEASKARVTTVPLEGGVGIDVLYRGFSLGPPGKSPFTIEIRDDGQQRHLSAAYRHPYSQKLAVGLFRDAAKKCFAEEYRASGMEPKLKD